MDISGINLQNKNLNIDKSTVIIEYNRYKDFFLPIAVIIISIFILFFVVVPEINQYFASKKEFDTETQKLTALKNNYNFLTNIDENKTVTDFNLLTKVLPSNKDFLGIMTSVSVAASKTGISVEDFNFSPGNLTKGIKGENAKFPVIAMTLKVRGGSSNFKDFLLQLYKTAPLAEVTTIKYENTQASLILNFFYKPFPPENISDDQPIKKLSNNDENLISELNSWDNISDTPDMSMLSGINLGTGSANFNFENSSSSASHSPFQ